MKPVRGWLWRRWLAYIAYVVLSLIATYAIKAGHPDVAISAIWASVVVHSIYSLSATTQDIVEIFKAAAEGLARAKDAAE